MRNGQNKTALVLGGTSGIGLGIARSLAAQGTAVTIAGRDAEKAEKAAANIALPTGGSAGAVSGIGLDLSRPEDIPETLRRYGKSFDIAVLNGPGYRPGRVTAATADDFSQAYSSMFLSLRQVVESVVGAMRENRWGRLLYVSSSSVVSPIGELAVSSVIRSAVNAYMKLLANDLAGDGITVNSIVPGRIDTPRVQAVDAARARDRGIAPDEVRAATEGLIPAGRYGTPEDMGELAAFLCSDRAGYLTGSAYRCDGGMITAL
ncbi:SDR family oxidoreductase [Streptomyces sp. NPDC057654]|uniref:SDR family oxidoreductase n=1 Tax=Streptomyces sp. NPDC057654 TaxID=3346196 RepID=UPI0036A50B8D